ncbi:hypothetical protein ACQR09_09395 [Bradyrhizobium oligotrophicum]|uniref:hypothetical protein n=1 Tax=Bradyrhizobium oligotrophicum TaxID=44255 RepID=UPI003EBA7173
MSTVSSSTSGSSGTTNSSSTVDQAMQQMQEAFNQAIQTNAEITSLKTTLGSIETVAQQRPNIG